MFSMAWQSVLEKEVFEKRLKSFEIFVSGLDNYHFIYMITESEFGLNCFAESDLRAGWTFVAFVHFSCWVSLSLVTCKSFFP